jgi:hypothetical protein
MTSLHLCSRTIALASGQKAGRRAVGVNEKMEVTVTERRRASLLLWGRRASRW